MSRRASRPAPLAVTALLAAACGDSAETPPALDGEPVAITFAGRVGAAPFDCSQTYEGLGLSSASAAIGDFRFYVHEVRLLDAAGAQVPMALGEDSAWQHDGVALLDFEDGTGACAHGTPETNVTLRGRAPAGTYTGVAFTLGVPFAANHADAARARPPLNQTALWWGWRGGYKFLRVDPIVARTGRELRFAVHLGSTGCVGDATGAGGVTACDRPNRPEVRVAGLDPTRDTLVADLAALLAGSRLDEDAGGVEGCLSDADDPECKPIFERLGLDPVTGAPAGEQQLFRKE